MAGMELSRMNSVTLSALKQFDKSKYVTDTQNDSLYESDSYTEQFEDYTKENLIDSKHLTKGYTKLIEAFMKAAYKGNIPFAGGLFIETVINYTETGKNSEFLTIPKQFFKDKIDKAVKERLIEYIRKSSHLPKALQGKTTEIIGGYLYGQFKRRSKTEIVKKIFPAYAKGYGGTFAINCIFNIVFNALGDLANGQPIEVEDWGKEICKAGWATGFAMIGNFCDCYIPFFGKMLKIGFTAIGSWTGDFIANMYETEVAAAITGVAVVAAAAIGIAVGIALFSNPVGWAALGVVAIAVGCMVVAALAVKAVEYIVLHFDEAVEAVQDFVADAVDAIGDAVDSFASAICDSFKAVFSW